MIGNGRVSPHNLGLLLLGAFPDSLIDAMSDAVRSHPADLKTQARLVYRRNVGQEPLFNFLPGIGSSLEDEDYGGIIGAMTVVMKDALAAQWTPEQYAIALARVGGISHQEARRIVDTFIVTMDSQGVLDMARKLTTWLPELPFGIEGPAKWALNAGMDWIAQALPMAMQTDSGDVLYEWRNMGKQMKQLGLRAELITRENAFEKRASYDWSAIKESAATLIPLLLKGLGMLMGGGAAGQGAKLLGQGMGDPGITVREIGDPATYAEFGDISREAGDLFAALRAARTPAEQGGLFSGLGKWFRRASRFVRKHAGTVLKKALPMAAGAIPGLGPVAQAAVARLAEFIPEAGDPNFSEVLSLASALPEEGDPAWHATSYLPSAGKDARTLPEYVLRAMGATDGQ